MRKENNFFLRKWVEEAKNRIGETYVWVVEEVSNRTLVFPR